MREKILLQRRVAAKRVTLPNGESLIDKGIKQAPNLYRLGASKIKNKNLRKAPESDVANYLIEETKKKQKKILIIYSASCKK